MQLQQGNTIYIFNRWAKASVDTVVKVMKTLAVTESGHRLKREYDESNGELRPADIFGGAYQFYAEKVGKAKYDRENIISDITKKLACVNLEVADSADLVALNTLLCKIHKQSFLNHAKTKNKKP